MAHIVLVAGKADSGKTYWVRKRIHLARRLLVVDTTGEWNVGGVAHGKVEALRRIRALSSADVRSFRLSCRVAAHETDAVLRALWALQPDTSEGGDPRYHVTVVCEEADLLDWTPPQGTRPPSGAYILANYGKRVARPLYLLTRRAALVGPNARANVGTWVQFEMDEPADLDALRQRFGKAGKYGDVVERVRALEGHRHIVFE